MAVGVPQLIDDGVQEAETCLIVQLDHNLLEELDDFFLACIGGLAIIFMLVTRDEKDDCADDGGVGHRPVANSLLGLHHLVAHFCDQRCLLGLEVVLQIVSEPIVDQVLLKVT